MRRVGVQVGVVGCHVAVVTGGSPPCGACAGGYRFRAGGEPGDEHGAGVVALVVWAAAGVLVTVSVLLEWRRHRAAQPEPGTRRLLAASRVFGRIPLPAGHFQDRVAEVGALERALGGNGQAALVALPGGGGRVRLSRLPRTRVTAMRRV